MGPFSLLLVAGDLLLLNRLADFARLPDAYPVLQYSIVAVAPALATAVLESPVLYCSIGKATQWPHILRILLALFLCASNSGP